MRPAPPTPLHAPDAPAKVTWHIVSTDRIYPPFFAAGLVILLTTGATLGVYLLWQAGVSQSFVAMSIYQINAHAMSQVFGWVGLFIMGTAYQIFPRFWKTQLVGPTLVIPVFILMVLGLILRTSAMLSAEHSSNASTLALIGGGFQIIAVLIFVAQLTATFVRGNTIIDPSTTFVLTGLGWLLGQMPLSVWHTHMIIAAGDWQSLLWYVATYQSPLRDLQLHGFVLFMILGVCLRIMPGTWGTPQPSSRGIWTGWAILLAAVLMEVGFFLAYRWRGNHVWAAFLMVPWILLLVVPGWLVWQWKLWRRPPQWDRSFKFIQAAYLWLNIAVLMLMLMPAYHLLSGIPFSHAYYGATQHALVVGFISMMIMGVASRFVATCNGIKAKVIPALWVPFVLVNAGCALRVVLQTLSDWHEVAFMLVGIAGLLKLAGFSVWAWHILMLLRTGRNIVNNATGDLTGPPGWTQ